MRTLTRADCDKLMHEDPELTRKRKETWRNMSDEKRAALMARSLGRQNQGERDKFVQATLELVRKQREAKELTEPQS